jgi:hypothetical protein
MRSIVRGTAGNRVRVRVKVRVSELSGVYSWML